jgi:hypothetical protein
MFHFAQNRNFSFALTGKYKETNKEQTLTLGELGSIFQELFTRASQN